MFHLCLRAAFSTVREGPERVKDGEWGIDLREVVEGESLSLCLSVTALCAAAI